MRGGDLPQPAGRQNAGVVSLGRLSRVVLDAADAPRLADFYAQLTGWPPAPGTDGLVLRSTAGPALVAQPAPDHVAPDWPGQDRPHQLHLDLDVPALAPAVERALALGATGLGGGTSWRTLADPAGHPFDLVLDRSRPAMSRVWVSVDAPDPSALAHFYSGLLGLEITHDTEAGAAIGAGGPVTVFFQPVAEYRRPRWPDPAHPQQGHLDVMVDDLDAALAWVTARGAEHLADAERGPVLADPAGHPFCLHGHPAVRG